MAENAVSTTKTPIETNSDLIAEVQAMVDGLPEAGGGTDISLSITSAAVGDIVKVKAVDGNGVPTEWEAYIPENFEVLIDTQVNFTEGVNVISLDLGKNDIAKEFVCWCEFSKSTGDAWGSPTNATPTINGTSVGYWILNKDFSVNNISFFADVNYEKPSGWCDWEYTIVGIATNIVGLNRQLDQKDHQTQNDTFRR